MIGQRTVHRGASEIILRGLNYWAPFTDEET